MESKKQRRSPQHESHILGKCRRGCARCSVAVRSDRRRGAEVPCLTAPTLCTQPEVQKRNKPKQENHKKRVWSLPRLVEDWCSQRAEASAGAGDSRSRVRASKGNLEMSQFTAIVGLFSDYRDLSEEVNGRSSKCGGGGGECWCNHRRADFRLQRQKRRLKRSCCWI